MTQCFLGIGSNIDPLQNVAAAVEWLKSKFLVLNVSPVYRSPSAGFVGDDFLNLAVQIETELSLEELKQRLKSYELHCEMQRNRSKYFSRIIDIDIVTFGDHVGVFSGIVIPRPEVFYRPYVLKPITDIARTVSLPKSRATYQGILKKRVLSEPSFLNSLTYVANQLRL